MEESRSQALLPSFLLLLVLMLVIESKSGESSLIRDENEIRAICV
jgi:hypothetical protein